MAKFQEFIFDMMIKAALAQCEENNKTSEVPTVPIIWCRSEHLRALVDYLRSPQNQKLFSNVGLLPIVQLEEARYKEELTEVTGAFINLLVLTSLICKETELSQNRVIALKSEAFHMSRIYPTKQLLDFVNQYLGVLIKVTDGKVGFN